MVLSYGARSRRVVENAEKMRSPKWRLCRPAPLLGEVVASDWGTLFRIVNSLKIAVVATTSARMI